MPSIRRLVIAFAAFLVIVVTGGVVIMVTRTPGWYRPPDPMDEQVVALADRVEYRLIEEAQKIREGDDDWTLRIRDDQVNAWLAARLPQWLANQGVTGWPESVGMPQVRFRDNALDIAATIETGGREQVVVVGLVPAIDENGFTVRLESVALGRIELPGDPLTTLIELAGDAVGEDKSVEPLLEYLQGKRSVEPRFDLADGREVWIDKLRVGVDSLDVTCRTE